MFEYSVLYKIRLDCKVYPSPYTHARAHNHNFYRYHQLTTEACLIFITSNLSLIQNTFPPQIF